MNTFFVMSLLDWIIFSIGLGAHAPLIVGLIKQEDISQVFFTWFLYLILDSITMISTILVGGNFSLLFGFTVGSFMMCAILLYQGRFGWGWLETFILILVGICIFMWITLGSIFAVIFGIISEIIIGLYLIYRTFKDPVVPYNTIGYFIFLIVSIFSFFNAKDNTIKEIGYSTCEIFLNTIVLIPLIYKWRKNGFKITDLFG